MAVNTNWQKPIKLGSGAYGTVFSNKKDEAVKISLMDSWDKVQSSLREFHSLAQLDYAIKEKHRKDDKPKVAEPLRFVELRKICYSKSKMHLFMNRADGNLSCLDSRDLSADTIEKFAIQLFQGLFTMRNHKMFHRDIKPENILIDLKTSTLSFCDFGLSRHLHDDTEYGTGYIVTRWYRAPELLMHQRDKVKKKNQLAHLQYTEKMDVYSVGVILYELIFDSHLAPGKTIDESLEILKRRIGRLTVEKLLKHPKVTEKVAKALVGCLAIEPKERFTCARTLFKLGKLSADEMVEYQEDKSKYVTLKYAPIQPERDRYDNEAWDKRSDIFTDIYKRFSNQKRVIAYALVIYDHVNQWNAYEFPVHQRFSFSIIYASLVIGSYYTSDKLMKYAKEKCWGKEKKNKAVRDLICKWTGVLYYKRNYFVDVSMWESGKFNAFNEFMKEALQNPYRLKRKR